MTTDNPVKTIAQIRADFPVLNTRHHDQPLAYLDNGATTQKPKCVADRMHDFYTQEYATIHRGVYHLSQKATVAVDEARRHVARFLNAPTVQSIIFTRGTTEAINLVAHSWGQAFINPGDEILISALEHHANIVPWQIVAQKTGAELKVIPMNQDGSLDLSDLDQLITDQTALVAMNHVSNALGTINPIQTVIQKARAHGAKILIDGAQAVSHMPVDVQALDCDFYAFSSHKLFGPSGIGVLYGKKDLLEKMPPYQTGGDMIETVTFEKTTYAGLPEKFEAGTPSIAEIIGLGEAITYIDSIGFETIQAQETHLLNTATAALKTIDCLNIIGTAANKASVISFAMDGIHPHDIGTILDEHNVAIRAGHHCAQPIMDFYGVPATARASFSVYNNDDDIQQLVQALQVAKELLG